MTFSQSVLTNLGSKYLFRIQGRASRSEYWWFTLFTLIVGMIEQVFVLFVPLTVMGVISLCISLALLPPTVGVTVRRLHDLDLSGLWLLLPAFFPSIACGVIISKGSVIALNFFMVCAGLIGIGFIVLMCRAGRPFPNRFGNPPVIESLPDN